MNFVSFNTQHSVRMNLFVAVNKANFDASQHESSNQMFADKGTRGVARDWIGRARLFKSRLTLIPEVYFSTSKCCSTLIFGKTLH